IDLFYRFYNEGLQLEASAKERKKTGKPVELTEREKTILYHLPKLKKAAKELSEIRKQIRAVQESPKYTPEQKRSIINGLEIREINIARKAIGRAQ
ncbi:MAG: hypothetical protein AB1523_16495, partial [Bacillota bacterium]